MAHQVRLAIGDLVLALVSYEADRQLDVEHRYACFVTDDQPDVMLRIHYGQVPKQNIGREVFASDGVWNLYRDPPKWIVSLHSPTSDSDPYQLAVFESDFLTGDIFGASQRSTHPHAFPLEYPLAEVIMVNLLSRGRGILIHALGVSDDGRGILFAGSSGAGKSTLAALWQGQEGVTLLSDDRVIVREREGSFWAYGTPWHGDARAVSPESVPLEHIFVIQHADENGVRPLEPVAAASHLLVRSFPTFWDAEGMAYTVELLSRLCQAVPCHELGFVPDTSVVDFVRCMTPV